MKILRRLALAALAALTLTAVGGQPALAIDGGGAPSGDLPYVGRLTATQDLGNGQVGERCGAALIAPGWALTAAHCLRYDAPSGSGNYAPGNVTVTFGSARADGAGGHTTTVSEIVRGAQDVALLRLTRNVPVAAVPLADRTPAEGSRAVALGWGRGTGSAPLKAADMRVDATGSGSMLVTVPDARSANSGAAHHGDSGGPLLVAAPTGGYALAGVAKSVTTSARGGVSNAWVRVDGDSPAYAWLAEHVPAVFPLRALP